MFVHCWVAFEFEVTKTVTFYSPGFAVFHLISIEVNVFCLFNACILFIFGLVFMYDFIRFNILQ